MPSNFIQLKPRENMPQGKVIAVKPLGFVGEDDVMMNSSFRTTDYSTASTRESRYEKEEVLYLIGVFKVLPNGTVTRKVESLVWLQAPEGKYAQGTRLTFEINTQNPRSIEANQAIGVEKTVSEKYFLIGGSLLSTIALFASALLIFAVVLDKKQ